MRRGLGAASGASGHPAIGASHVLLPNAGTCVAQLPKTGKLSGKWIVLAAAQAYLASDSAGTVFETGVGS